jgi:cyclophilin family peptidyl-prolyl cis-trans isomerase
LSFLDNKYVIFGRVISGMRALKMIEKSEQVNERPVQAALVTAAGDYSVSKKLDIKAKK